MKLILPSLLLFSIVSVSQAAPSYELSSTTQSLNLAACESISSVIKIVKRKGTISERDKEFFDTVASTEGVFATIRFSSTVTIPKNVMMPFLDQSLPVATLKPTTVLEQTDSLYTVELGRPIQIHFNLLGICQYYTTAAMLDSAAKKTVESLILPHVTEVKK